MYKLKYCTIKADQRLQIRESCMQCKDNAHIFQTMDASNRIIIATWFDHPLQGPTDKYQKMEVEYIYLFIKGIITLKLWIDNVPQYI